MNAPQHREQLGLAVGTLPRELVDAYEAAAAAAGVVPPCIGAGLTMTTVLGEWVEVIAPGGPFAFFACTDLAAAGRELFDLVQRSRRT